VASKIDRVRAVFHQPQWYLRRAHNIRIRKETVQAFLTLLTRVEFASILDVGCGDGSISLPLLTAQTRLTLLDLSDTMLSVARSQIPPQFAANVDVMNGDFLAAKLGTHTYDLILCIGVLAHVDSPSAIIEEIMRLLKPGGIVIIENTDSHHPISHFLRLYDTVRGLLLPAQYSRNLISAAEIVDTFIGRGCKLLDTYRYSLPVPGVRRVLADSALYKMIRLLYGAYPHVRLSWLGNECIHIFRSGVTQH
jgi:2-polyprenyl-3-methyl-5-hydroxy-6-metoxy-1,4-benzoquinol methylase